VQQIGIFGSYAKNEAKEKSDIDVFTKLNKTDYRTAIFRK
jgi:predicted nucleotidyltransferase